MELSPTVAETLLIALVIFHVVVFVGPVLVLGAMDLWRARRGRPQWMSDPVAPVIDLFPEAPEKTVKKAA